MEFENNTCCVAWASKGEGLGNKFLANIRETYAIAHVVRCFDDDNIIHVDNTIDPAADIEVINTELALADLDTRSEEHTSELQSRGHLVCRLLLAAKKRERR